MASRSYTTNPNTLNDPDHLSIWEGAPLLSSSSSSTTNNYQNKTISSPPPSTRSGPIYLPRSQFLVLLSTLYFGTFLAAVDSTIVSTLLSSISSDLKALNSISWVATAYSVAYSALQPLYGKLSDIYGSRKVLISCTFIFGLGCQVCASANGMGVLIIGRLLNGVGAGGMLSVGAITLSFYVSARERGLYQGIGNVVFGIGAASGGIVGSAAEALRGWRFAFSLQVPLSVLSIAIIYFNLIERKPTSEVLLEDSEIAGHTVRRSSLERLDFVGSFSLASFVCLMMLAVTTGGNQFPWVSWPISTFVICAILTAILFFYWETHRALEPVLPIWLLTDRTILSCCLVNFFGTAVAYGFIYFVPIYLAACQNFSATQVSHRLIFQFVGGPTGSVGAGLIMRKTGKYWSLCVKCTIGIAIGSAMWVAMPLLPPYIGAKWFWQGGAFFLTGVCYTGMLTLTLVILITAAPSHQATVTSVQYTFRGAGSSMGVAVASAVFNNALAHQLAKNITGEGAKGIIDKVSKSIEAIYQVPKMYRAKIIESYETASVLVFSVSLIMCIFVVIPSFFILELPLKHYRDDSSESRD